MKEFNTRLKVKFSAPIHRMSPEKIVQYADEFKESHKDCETEGTKCCLQRSCELISTAIILLSIHFGEEAAQCAFVRIVKEVEKQWGLENAQPS